MKTIMIFLSITMLLAGCASKPDYRAATNGQQDTANKKYQMTDTECSLRYIRTVSLMPLTLLS